MNAPGSSAPVSTTSPSLNSLALSSPAPSVSAPAVVERCPSEMSLVLDSVCIDRWEASLLEEQPDGSTAPWSPYRRPSAAAGALRAVSVPGVVPQGYISGEEASLACEAAGKRLCQVSEWEAGCRGSRGLAYPYGDERKEHVCNDAGRDRHPVIDLHQRLGLPKEDMWRNGMAHPLINVQPDTVTRTGELAACTSDAGTFDMVGNLHEWVADPDGTFRGGFYMDTQINGEGCNYATTAHPMSYADYSTGFRCCKDAAPLVPTATSS